MSAGVCSVVKSKPRRVRRSISNGSLDVHGTVTVEKVWLADGDILSSSHLPVSIDHGCLGSRKSHMWSLHTNLSCTQHCIKCEKRIQTRRAAYKCTVCKKLSHLKCAINDHPVASRTRSRRKCREQKLSSTETIPSRLEGHTISTLGMTREREGNNLVRDEEKNYYIEESDSLAEFIMEENNCKADCSTQTHNTTVRSQAKQTLCNVRTNFVRRCKSIKKKVEKLRDKLNCDAEDQPKSEEDTVQKVPFEAGIADEEGSTTTREAWLCSPVRKRRKSRLKENESEDSKPERFSYKRNTHKRRIHVHNQELADMNDRLEVVERKISVLEQSIPQEIEQWRKLQQKFQISDRFHSNEFKSGEPLVVHETIPKSPAPEENLASDNSVTTSDEMVFHPDSLSGCQGDRNRNNLNTCIQTGSSGREENFPSAIPPRLQIVEQSETSESCGELHQTSTPVTNKEISFHSATKKYKISQLTHKNITHIKMEDKVEQEDRKNVDMRNTEKEVEPDTSAEKTILSPNQLAVRSFLERRRSYTESRKTVSKTEQDLPAEVKVLSPSQLAVQKFLERRKSNQTTELINNAQTAVNKISKPGFENEEVVGNKESVSNSPVVDIASSTFVNGNGDVINPLLNMSPIPYTCKNGFDSSGVSHSRSSEGSKTNDKRTNDMDNSAFNISAFSYTFRNDSSMIHTDANENLPGFSDNLPRVREVYNSTCISSPRKIYEAQQRSVAFASMPTEIAASTTERLSLTNVTEISPGYPDSFSDSKDNPRKEVKSDFFNNKRLSDEFLTQIKSGVKLKDTSLESKDDKEETSVNNLSEDSELKLVFDKIVKRDKRAKSKHDVDMHFVTKQFKIDETGDNGHSTYTNNYSRKKPYSQLGSKYYDLFRFCNPEQPLVANQCEETTKYSQPTSNVNMGYKIGPPLPPKPKKTHGKTDIGEAEKHDPEYLASASLDKKATAECEKDESIAVKKESPLVDATGDKNLAELETNENRNISEIKSDTFPRTAKKPYTVNHFDVGGTYIKAASYAGSLDIDRRSVYTETGSLDRYGDAKYHFLHEKGMIKIRSPRLELVSESPSSKRKFQTTGSAAYHISEEDTNTVGSSSDVSGVVIDNEFHLNEYKQRLNDFNDLMEHIVAPDKNNIENKDKPILEDKHRNEIAESYTNELDARQQDLANDIFENCLQLIDNNQATLDHVLDWMDKGCNDNSDSSVKAELEALTGGESRRDIDRENTFQSPVDDSVYYSFQGQSEEIRKMMTELETDSQMIQQEDQLMKDFLIAVMNENHAFVSEFCESGNTMPNVILKEALNFALKQEDHALANELLNYACKLLKKMDMNEIIDVWPAYLEDDIWNPVFVVLRKSDSQHEWDEFLGYRVHLRKYTQVSREATVVVSNELVKTSPVSFDDFQILKEALEEINLHEHRNITLIDFCPCRSRKGGEEMMLEKCIVIHCLVKGLIPFNEKPFPTSILGIPVDVREGYFSQGVHRDPQWQTGESCTEISDTTEVGSTGGEGDSVRTSTSLANGVESETSYTAAKTFEECCTDVELVKTNRQEETSVLTENVEADYYLGNGDSETAMKVSKETVQTTANGTTNTLKMGTCIYNPDDSSQGTLGGFIRIDGGEMGFITCAHVVGNDVGRVVSVADNGHSKSVCGKVTKAACAGVDAALVRITSRQPDRIEFIDVTDEQLKAAGFSRDDPPRFCKGRIIALDELGRCWSAKVLKIGSSTGLTNGRLYSYGAYVRRDDQEGAGKQSLELYNQLEVLSVDDSIKFFDLGDSGALVFMQLNDHDLYCVGLAVGCTSYGSCIVTPIEHVFKQLNLPAQFYCCQALGL